MRILLTGAAGRLGSRVCRRLVEAGHAVVATDNHYRADLPVAIRVADLTDPQAIYPLLEGCQALVHLANHADLGRVSPPQRLYAENVAMNGNAFHAAFETGVRQLVFASSVQAISGERNRRNGTGDRPSCLPYLPLDEHVPACPGNLYAVSKANGETLLRHYAALDARLSCTAIRFPHLCNPGLDAFQRHRRHTDDLARLDEAFTTLDFDDAATLIDRVLAANRPGYMHFLPAARENYLGWAPSEVAARFYPNVPIRQPLDALGALVDLRPLERLYGWRPTPQGPLPRWEDAASTGAAPA